MAEIFDRKLNWSEYRYGAINQKESTHLMMAITSIPDIDQNRYVEETES